MKYEDKQKKWQKVKRKEEVNKKHDETPRVKHNQKAKGKKK